MPAVYIIRHAQAGPRHDYDKLSDLGRDQARRLGRHLAHEGVRFSAVFRGGLKRHILTAQAVEESYQEAGADFPDVIQDTRWDEFDMDQVYRSVGPRLCRDDERFRDEFERMRQELANGGGDLHRRHTYCDIAVVEAWVDQRYAYEGESWEVFRRRILSPLDRLREFDSGAKIAVFTSATPIGIWVGKALDLNDRNTWRTAGVTLNSGVTTLRVSSEEVRLFTFNGVPHLSDEKQRSFR